MGIHDDLNAPDMPADRLGPDDVPSPPPKKKGPFMRKFPEIRIKIISLADEARTIRKEEKGLTGEKRAEVHNHRVCDVRSAARTALLAYAFLRNKPYRSVEPSTRWDRKPNYDRPQPYCSAIAELVIRYGTRLDLARLEAHARKRVAYDLISNWIKVPAAAPAQATNEKGASLESQRAP